MTRTLHTQDNFYMTQTYPYAYNPTQYHMGYSLDFAAFFMLLGTMFMGMLTLFSYQYIKKEKHRRTNTIYTDEDMQNQPVELGARMKFFEDYSNMNISVIPHTYAFILKLDGRGFSRLLKKFNTHRINSFLLPYSDYVRKAIVYTIADLIKEFHATTGYTYLDKIFLVFPQEKKEHMFRGNVNKLNSVISSYATARFIVNLNDILSNLELNEETVYLKDMISHETCKLSFVSNIIVFSESNKLDLVNYLAWHNNTLAPHSFRQHLRRVMHSKNTHLDLDKYLLNKYNINYDHIDFSVRHGMFIKREEDNGDIKYVKFIIAPSLETNQDVYDFMCDRTIQEWEYRLVVDIDTYNYNLVDVDHNIPIYYNE